MPAAPRLAVRPAHLLLALLLAAVFVPVLLSLVVDRLGWGMTATGAARILWSSVLLLAAAALIAWRSGYVLDRGLPALAELVLLAAALAVSAGFLLSLAGSPLLPVGTSVDGGWHYARSDYLHSGGRLGVYQSRLGNVNAYSPGFHLLVALLAHWSGREPIFTLYPAAVLMFALLMGAAVQVAMDAVADPRWCLLGGCAALLALVLAPTGATLEIIAREQFYPTAAGLAWLLAGVWGAGLLQRSGHPLALPVLSASAVGIVLFYPFWLAIALGLLAAMIVALRWRLWRRLLLELAVVLGATGVGLLLVHDLLGDQADFVRWEQLRSQAGILALATALVFPALALCRRLVRWRLLPLLMVGALAAMQYGVLNHLRNQPFAEYMAHKTHYLFPYLLAGLGAGLVGAAAAKLRRVPAVGMGAGGVALLLMFGTTNTDRQRSPGWLGFSDYHPLTPDQVAAGIWMRDHLPPDPENVSFVVDNSITAYWLKTGILRGERGWSASSVQRYDPPRYAHWLTDPATPAYAIVAGADRASGPPMRVLFEHGTASVVERVPEDRPGERAVHVQVYSAIEQYAGRPTIRSAAYLASLPDPAFELRFLLTEQRGGDEPPSALWDQPLSTHTHASGRYGLVRLDPAAPAAWTWLDGAPRGVSPPALAPGMALSGWMQLRYDDQPVATRRIYDFVVGDAGSFVPRDLNPNSTFHWQPSMPAGAPPGRVAGVTMGDRVTLERWDISPAMVEPGAAATLSAEWQAAGPVEPPARLFVHLVDAEGHSYPVWDGEPQSGFYPFWLWRSGKQIRDAYQLQIPGDLPTGEYAIAVGVYNPVTGIRLPVTRGPASGVEGAGHLGTLRVK